MKIYINGLKQIALIFSDYKNESVLQFVTKLADIYL